MTDLLELPTSSQLNPQATADRHSKLSSGLENRVSAISLAPDEMSLKLHRPKKTREQQAAAVYMHKTPIMMRTQLVSPVTNTTDSRNTKKSTFERRHNTLA